MKPRSILTLGNFFGSAHFFLIIYIVAPYLATFMPDSAAGLVVSLGAIGTLSVFPFMPQLIRKYGARHLAIYFGIAQLVVLGLLALEPGPMPAFLLVALTCAIAPLISYQMDLLLEATVAREEATGRIRTLFLTSGSIALILAPMVLAWLLDGTNAYWRVFAVASASTIPFIILMSLRPLPHGTNMNIVTLAQAFQCLIENQDTRATVLAHATLQFFYHLAPFYIPLYLHSVLQIPWSTLGLLFTIMLLPFVLLEYPAGWLADRKWGDKEILLAGFVLLAASFAALALVNADTMILLILFILILNRSGAALVEAMTEGHFFRRISKEDDAAVGVFRITRPLAALSAPIVGSIILSVSSYGTLFVVTGLLIGIVGVSSTLKIRDIK